MVKLKPSSLITAAIVITLIVLTIIDHVFSDDEVKRCKRYIENLYYFQVYNFDEEISPEFGETIREFHNGFTEFYITTTDDEIIGNDRFKMFKKGFLVFNTEEIQLINRRFLDHKDGSADSEELKEMVREMLGEYIATHEIDDDTNTKLESFAADAARISEAVHLKILVRTVFEFVTQDEPSLSLAQFQSLVSKMDEYTIAYFKEFLNKVSIDGKESLNKPADFCRQWLPGKPNNALICTKIIKKKFKLNDDISGSEIFDLLYKEWSGYQVKKVFELHEELQEMDEHIASIDPNERRSTETYYRKLNKLYLGSLKNFYKQFVDILDKADISDMPTTKDFCNDYINNRASTSAV